MPAKTQTPTDTGAMLISALAIPGEPEQVRTAPASPTKREARP